MTLEIEARDPLVGTTIDNRYLVHGVLGRGGMGVVYDAVHEQLGRPVAIKVLGAGIAGDPVAVKRFLKEAQTASKLTHGNIVDVSDLGQLPDGRPYLVMPKMNGVDLVTILEREGPLSPARVVELLRGAAAALDLIHAKGLVHRDVKPENLMHVVREDGSETTLLLDFGIATLVSSNAARLTAEGKLFGTPAYLPPEILNGDLPDRRGDIYALATMAFELMTGHTPYEAKNPVRILPMKMLQEPRRLNEVGPRRFSRAIEDVIAQGMVRDPDLRPSSAGKLIQKLDEAVRASGASAMVLDAGAARDVPFARSSRSDELALSTDELELASDGITSEQLFESNRSAEAEAATPPPRPMTDLAGTERANMETGASALQIPLHAQRLKLFVFAGVSTLGALLLWLSASGEPEPSTQALSPGGAPLTAASEAARSPEAAAPAVAPQAEPTPAEPAPAAEPGLVAEAPNTEATEPAAPEAAAEPKPEPSRRVAVKPAARPEASGAARAKAAEPKPAAQPSGPSVDELNREATSALMQGRMAQAADLYARATRLSPRSEAAWRGLGLTSERLGRTQDAVRAYKRALDIAPQGLNAATIRTRLAKLETSR